jgi:sugar phosphate isomerase/epimerase
VNHSAQTCSRRAFLKSGALTAISAALASRAARAQAAADPPFFTAHGIAASIDQADSLWDAGAQFLTESVGRFLVPDQPEDVFDANLARLEDSPLPILAVNGFIRPPHLRCVGADAAHDLVLEWAERTFRRARRADATFVVFGSSGSRQLRDGWSRAQADEQFRALLRRMGPLAEEHGITVVLEQLRAQECNYINSIGEAAAMVRSVDHPRIRILADLYHMAHTGDTPADLEAAMDVVVHVEIAEKEGRTVPGVAGDDFRPFFRVLRRAGYRGAISIEGRWEISQIGPAFKEIERQAAEA